MDQDGSPKFCDTCCEYDFEALLYCPDFEWKTLGQLQWKSVAANHRECCFCALLFDSLTHSKDFSSRLAAGEGKTLIISSEPLGRVECSTNGEAFDHGEERHWHQYDGVWKRTVRFMRVFSKGVVSRPPVMKIFPLVDSSTVGRNRLLHYTTLPQPAINLELLKRWINVCQTHHAAKCSNARWIGVENAGLRMVDVNNGCVVKLDRAVEYIALSYCWGQQRESNSILQLTSTTEDLLGKPGSLCEASMCPPATIQDAIDLTRSLGLQYLWVDALCIVQDDESQRRPQLEQMHVIYSHAALTIIAADGEDAHHGLTGFRNGIRNLHHVSQQCLGTVSLVASTLCQGDYARACMEQSYWASRAWTYQESVCSRRKLVFTGVDVLWLCDAAIWIESYASEPACLYPNTRTALAYEEMRFLGPSSPVKTYNQYIGAASHRRLSYEADRIDCIKGLLNMLISDFPAGFLWGHPVDILEHSLLFECDDTSNQAPFERRSTFPSWSWAGNVSAFRLAGYVMDYELPKSTFRKVMEVARLTDEGNNWIFLPSVQIPRTDSGRYAESAARWASMDLRSSLDETKGTLEAQDVPSTHIIAFWTQCVHLPVVLESAFASHKVRGPQGEDLGRIFLPHYYCGQHQNELLFLLIAERQYEDRTRLQLLHVEQKNGITYRIDVMKDSEITPQIWDTLDTHWEFIIMA